MAMYGPHNKWCFVPCCTSTSVSTPNKIFVRVPQDYGRKELWFSAARRDMPKSKSEFFCCEDHFKLEEDMENYVRFKMMGGKIFMKRDVVPHIFECQLAQKRTGTNVLARSLKRERKRLVAEAQAADEQRFSGQPLALDTPSTSTAQIQEEVQQESASLLINKKSIGIQVRPSFRSKYQIPSEDPEDEPGPSSRFRDDDPLANMKVEPEEVKLDPAYVKSEPTEEESSESALQFPDKILMGWYDDDVDTFFKKVADTVKQLPDYLATEARQRIFEMLRELQERAVKKENVL